LVEHEGQLYVDRMKLQQSCIFSNEILAPSFEKKKTLEKPVFLVTIGS